MLNAASDANPATGNADADAVLSWSVHLLRQRPQGTGRIVLGLAATFVCGLILFHSLLLALLPMTALFLALSEYLLPIRYTLTERSATARWGLTVLEIAWRDVRHVYVAPGDGLKLSPLAVKNSRWERLRGVWLRFEEADRERITAEVRRLRDAAQG